MDVLLTWPVYGVRLAGPARGGTTRRGRGEAVALPEPLPEADAPGKWPAVRLSDADRAVILADLQRIARLRDFRVHHAVADADHLHLLLRCGDGRDLPRLVQLIKGALSRALSLAAGDEPVVSSRGETLPHRKWWARRHDALILPEAPATALDACRRALAAHPGAHLDLP